MNSAVILFMYLQILASQMKNHLWMTHLLVYCLQKVTTLIIHNLMKMLAPPMFYLVKVLTPSVLMKWGVDSISADETGVDSTSAEPSPDESVLLPDNDQDQDCERN